MGNTVGVQVPSSAPKFGKKLYRKDKAFFMYKIKISYLKKDFLAISDKSKHFLKGGSKNKLFFDIFRG